VLVYFADADINAAGIAADMPADIDRLRLMIGVRFLRTGRFSRTLCAQIGQQGTEPLDRTRIVVKSISQPRTPRSYLRALYPAPIRCARRIQLCPRRIHAPFVPGNRGEALLNRFPRIGHHRRHQGLSRRTR
jgi:hypothetical protein